MKRRKKNTKKGETCCPWAPAADCQKRFTFHGSLSPSAQQELSRGEGSECFRFPFVPFPSVFALLSLPGPVQEKRGAPGDCNRCEAFVGSLCIPLPPCLSTAFFSHRTVFSSFLTLFFFLLACWQNSEARQKNTLHGWRLQSPRAEC